MTISDNGKPRGLPGPLPADERILLQTTPSWRSLAIHAFHARKIATHCLALVFWRIARHFAAGRGWRGAGGRSRMVAPIALAGILLPALLAWSYARTTIYTITNRRIVLRAGVALPMFFQPSIRAQIDSAALKQYADGTGDIPLKRRRYTPASRASVAERAPWRINTPGTYVARGGRTLRTVANVPPGARRRYRLNPAAAPSMTAGEPVHHLETAAA